MVPCENTSLPEPEELIKAKLSEFESEVDAIAADRKANLFRAVEACPELLTRDFKLSFLRTEVMQPNLAAQRYVVYWDLRVKLFGSDKAFLPLTLEGALKDDVDTIRQGFIRAVEGHSKLLLIDPSRKENDYDIDSIARSIWYVATKALTAEKEMQRDGAIFVLDMANFGSFDRKLIKRITEVTNFGFPLRCAMCCIINPPLIADALVSICKLFLRAKVRNKIRVLKTESKFEKHAGLSSEELHNAVNHEKWMARMNSEESSVCNKGVTG